MTFVHFSQTVIGPVGIAEENGRITRLQLAAEKTIHPPYVEKQTPLLRRAFRQLHEYLAGKRKTFTLPLAPCGTPFHLRVLEELAKIPYGQCTTYGELARRAGSPNAARAVGRAMNTNPIAIFLPCHRVIGANGALTGFGAGLPLKQKLLELEGFHA